MFHQELAYGWCADFNVTGEQAGEEVRMQDIIWIAITVVFFGAAIGYVRFCNRME
jgi:hypothetical protein